MRFTPFNPKPALYFFTAFTAAALLLFTLLANADDASAQQAVDNTPTSTNTPTATAFRAVSAGDGLTCGIRTDGAAVCWGLNAHDQISPPSGVFTSISAGFRHACGLRADGAAVCWGDAKYNRSTPPTPPSGAFASISVASVASVGYSHTCGLRADGAAVCWGGRNIYGEATPPTGAFASISANTSYTCGLRNDGAAVCWGYDGFGQSTPPADETFASISTGHRHACGLRADGAAVCWGYDGFGQSTPPAGETFASISAGTRHTCGLRNDGVAVCWGLNDHGQTTPPAGETFASISGGGSHNCGLRADGAVVCWGKNQFGESTPPATSAPIETPIPTLTPTPDPTHTPTLVNSPPYFVYDDTDCATARPRTIFSAGRDPVYWIAGDSLTRTVLEDFDACDPDGDAIKFRLRTAIGEPRVFAISSSGILSIDARLNTWSRPFHRVEVRVTNDADDQLDTDVIYVTVHLFGVSGSATPAPTTTSIPTHTPTATSVSATGEPTLTPTSTSVSATDEPAPTATATHTPTSTSVSSTSESIPTPTSTSVTGEPAPTLTPTATGVSTPVGDGLDEFEEQVGALRDRVGTLQGVGTLNRLIESLRGLINALTDRVAELEGTSPTATPTHTPTPTNTPVTVLETTPTPTATSTSVPTATPTRASASTLAPGCIRKTGLGWLTGTWSADCLSDKTPVTAKAGTRYARFYTFTLDTASTVTVNITSDDVADTYLYLLEGVGNSGAVVNRGDTRITEQLQAGSYTIEATTYHLNTSGNFMLTLDISTASVSR